MTLTRFVAVVFHAINSEASGGSKYLFLGLSVIDLVSSTMGSFALVYTDGQDCVLWMMLSHHE